MNNETKNKKQKTIDLFLLLGLVLSVLNNVADRFIAAIPDVIAYPWLIIACICIIFGVYRTAKIIRSNE